MAGEWTLAILIIVVMMVPLFVRLTHYHSTNIHLLTYTIHSINLLSYTICSAFPPTNC